MVLSFSRIRCKIKERIQTLSFTIYAFILFPFMLKNNFLPFPKI